MSAGARLLPVATDARAHRGRVAGVTWGGALLALALAVGPARADEAPRDTLPARPFVRGGYDDKPHHEGLFGRIRIGGYLDAVGSWTRDAGVTAGLGLELRRWNLLASTDLGHRVQVWSELEIEGGGEEVRLELAQVDLRLWRGLNLRTGMLLLPLGRFNLAHDAPRGHLPDRPVLSDELLGVALAMPGLGGFGEFGSPVGMRWTWEFEGVTGFHDGLLLDSPDGIRLPAGRINPADANDTPGWVGRVEWSPTPRAALGVSGYHGAYNRFRIDGLPVDERRDIAVAMLDGEATLGGTTLQGEFVAIEIEIPASLVGRFATRQAGGWVEVSHVVLREVTHDLPGSSVTAVVRFDAVDFDRDRIGDAVRSVAVGIAFRPLPESAFKLAWTRGERLDRFGNPTAFARLQLAVATYF